MSSNQVTNQNMKLEVVVLPVADVDRSKDFYKTLGWQLNADFVTSEDFPVVQLTPPGSEASIILGQGISSAASGSVQGLYPVAFLASDDASYLTGVELAVNGGRTQL